ncbi:hypothetical protein CRI65_05210 [Escherichia sp. E3659]|nr:hypothetical protein CRI65_05210 [Escherichia sp. E3659]
MKARKHISALCLEQVNLFFIYKEYYFLTLQKIVRLYEPGNYQTSNALLPKKNSGLRIVQKTKPDSAPRF